MAVQTNNPAIDRPLSATVAAHRLITAAGAQCALDDNRDWIGASQQAGDSGDRIGVRLPSAGTMKLEASEAISSGDRVYKAADGKISATSTSSIAVGIALEAASGAGSIIEILPD